MSENGITLPGKIAVSSANYVCSIYDNSDTSKVRFKLRNDKQISYSGLHWTHQGDAFVGGEYLKTTARGINRGNIVCFDLAGNVIDRIYESQEGEIAWPGYLSRSDKQLLFTTHLIADTEINPFEGLTPMLSIVIMDFKQKKLIKRIDSIGRSPNFELNESPWLCDENHFVYSMSSENKVVNNRDILNPITETVGIYVYDLNTHQKKLVAPGGRFAIASPVNLQIAYLKDQSVLTLDLKSNTTKIIYEAGSKEKVSNIHWTPDGKYIYLVYFDYYVLNFFTSGERLIDISTGKEIHFKKIGHGFETYTWK